jgi:hypothetical protein
MGRRGGRKESRGPHGGPQVAPSIWSHGAEGLCACDGLYAKHSLAPAFFGQRMKMKMKMKMKRMAMLTMLTMMLMMTMMTMSGQTDVLCMFVWRGVSSSLRVEARVTSRNKGRELRMVVVVRVCI